MKKLLCIIFSVFIMLLIVGCADKTEPETAVPETQAEIVSETVPEAASAPKEEKSAGLANPMVEVPDYGVIEDQLGIKINTNKIVTKKKLFIINKELAHIVWNQKNVNNEDVEFVLRATKNPELGPVCHGIQGEISPINTIELTATDGSKVDLCCGENGGYTIYTWKYGDTFYSLTYDKSMSQMAMAEVLDQVMFATGTVIPVKSVLPLPEAVDVSNIADGIYSVFVPEDGINESDGKYILTCDVYTRELFDVIDVHTLNPGDTVTIGGDLVITVETAEEKDGEIVINGGDEGDGGCILCPNEGGTYVYRGPDDIASYSLHGTAVLEIADDVILTDTSDIDNGCREVTVNGAADAVDYLTAHQYARLTPSSGSIRTENQKVVEIKTWYTP